MKAATFLMLLIGAGIMIGAAWAQAPYGLVLAGGVTMIVALVCSIALGFVEIELRQ